MLRVISINSRFSVYGMVVGTMCETMGGGCADSHSKRLLLPWFYLIKGFVMTDCQYSVILQTSSDAVRTYYTIKKKKTMLNNPKWVKFCSVPFLRYFEKVCITRDSKL